MEILKLAAGPLIGAVIGYFTNYIAVKMLFYPRNEVYVWGHKLPFTPGAIPKGKSRLAKAIGNIIENNLLTQEDLEKKLLSETTVQKLTDIIIEKLSGTIRDNICSFTELSEETYAERKSAVSRAVSVEIVQAMQESDITETIFEKATDMIKEKTQGSMMSLFFNEKAIHSIMQPVKENLDAIIAENGVDYISPMIENKLSTWDSDSALHLMEQYAIDEQKIRGIIKNAYQEIISRYAEKLFKNLHISTLVENKINDMAVDEMEQLVLQVMKKEFDTIVNLGAWIGFILGLLNLII